MHDEALEHFLDEGLIEHVIRPIKSGKEASVHLCRANPRTTGGETLAALKLYHPLDRRDFRDEQLYRDGEYIKERRIRVALEQKTKFGRQVQGASGSAANGRRCVRSRPPAPPCHARSSAPTAPS